MLLFIVPFIGLIGSLLVNNYLVSYKYYYETTVPFKKNSPGSTYELICSKENNMCSNFKKISKLDECNKFVFEKSNFSKDGLIELSKDETSELEQVKIQIKAFEKKLEVLEEESLFNSDMDLLSSVATSGRSIALIDLTFFFF